MKKIIFLFVISLAAFSCKNSEKKDGETTSNETNVNASLYKGEFIYIADAAVLKGEDFIYGVTLDDMAKELSERVEPAKNDEFDMVSVIVKGVVNKKAEGQEGWDEIITIKEILEVSKVSSGADVKIEETQS